MSKPFDDGTYDLRRRIEAVVTAFRAETQINLPVGYASISPEAGDKFDTVNGDFAWWCVRHEAVLVQHGLYAAHPVATVIRAWQKETGEPSVWCHLTMRAPVSHQRIYWPDDQAQTDWRGFCDAGYAPEMTYAAWRSTRNKPSRPSKQFKD